MEILEQKSNKGNKIFFIIFFLLIAISVAVTFVKIVILKDYQIVAQVSCYPTIEKCFVSECDPEVDEACTTDSAATYFKNISKNAGTIYACEQTTEKSGCGDELSCLSGEPNCSYTYCDPANLAEGETCSE